MSFKRCALSPALKVMWPEKAACKVGYIHCLYTDFQVDFTLVSTETEP